MGKIIFYGFIALLIYWLINYRRPKQKNSESFMDIAEDTVVCNHCGVYLPKKEAINCQNQFFCCQEHRDDHIKSSS
ncbi:MAG: hypothetical protein A4S08_10420 [Proteobacteria bacterium SG_bin4]|nr:MAG: hypothetical protein A4S08_10420 [Proteobacteria bacterium SG_bin4]